MSVGSPQPKNDRLSKLRQPRRSVSGTRRAQAHSSEPDPSGASRDRPDRDRRTPLATTGCTKRQLSVFPRTAEPEHRPREPRTRQKQPCGQTSSQTPEFQVQRLRPPVQPPTTVHATVAVYFSCVNARRARMPPETSTNSPSAA